MKIDKVFLFILPLFGLFSDLQAQWVSIGSGLQNDRSIWSLSVINENTVWATAWDKQGNQPAQDFTRTSDGGDTWHPGLVPMPNSQYGQHIFALDSLTAWVAAANFTLTSGGIYKTNDGGVTWTHQETAYPSPTAGGPQAVHFFDENDGFTFGFGFNSVLKAYYTMDGGVNWQEANVPSTNFNELVENNTGNGMYEVVGDTCWFVTNQARVIRSINRGQDWEVVGKAFTPVPDINSGPNSIAFKDAQHGVVVSYWPPEAAVTSDGGTTWNKLENFPTTEDVIQVEYIPGTNHFITHGGYGINQNMEILKICYSEVFYEGAGANMNVDVLQFISSDIGFGGDLVLTPDSGGVYKWNGDMDMDCSPIVSTTNEKFVFPLTILPNPATNYLRILPPETLDNNLSCRIFNLQGQEVSFQLINPHETIQLNGFSQGIHVIEITAEDRVYIGKVLVK